MKTTTTGLFVGNIDPVYQQKIEQAYLKAKPLVTQETRSRYGTDPIIDGGACLMWAIHGANELKKLGITTTIQAGTMLWRCVEVRLRDTVSKSQPFNFGYQFSYDNAPAAERIMSHGGMPEMHVWLADHQRSVIIDFSTGGVKGHFTVVKGDEAQWLAPEPPPYLVAAQGEFGDENGAIDGHGMTYTPDAHACFLAIKYGQELFVDDCPALEVPEKFQKIVDRSLDLYMSKHLEWLLGTMKMTKVDVKKGTPRHEGEAVTC